MKLPIGLLSLHKACAIEERRYLMTAVSLSCDGKNATAVATDSKILVAAEWPCEEQFSECFIPASSFRTLDKAAPKELENHTLEVFNSDGLLTLSLSTTKDQTTIAITSRPLEGRFPPWRDILPKTKPISAAASPWKAPDVDPVFLGNMMAAVSALMGKNDGKRVTLFEQAEGCPLHIHNEFKGMTIRAAIMPLS